MNWKLSDSKIIGLLVIVLVAQIMVLLWHLDILKLNKSTVVRTDDQAGVILSVSNSVQHRPMDSLVWEKSEKEQPLFYNDSVLTLSQSNAIVRLKNETQIALQENTLITIEPPQVEKPNEIRVQFSQGTLSARNPYQKAEITTEKFSLSLSANSDVQIFKDQSDQIEVQVKKGEAELTVDGKKSVISEDSVASISGSEVKEKSLSHALQFEKTYKNRVYTHSEEAKISLDWKGQAQWIIFHNHEKKRIKIPIEQNRTRHDFNLKLGSHRFFLANENQRSEAITIEVWKAPIIHLVSPRPRDRVKQGQTHFIWTQNPSVRTYELKINGKANPILKNIEQNSIQVSFDKDDDLYWEVWGKDKDGYTIPPSYNYKLYIRENPFSAPKIKQHNIQESNASHWLEQFFIPSAYANDLKTTYLSWQPIEGADFYLIEISDSMEFRNLILKKEVNNPEFIWNQFDKSKKLYWRVAAGDNSGRMGVFSEPLAVKLIPAPKKEVPKQKNPVKAKQIEKVTQSPPVPKPEPKAIITPPAKRKVKQKKKVAELPLFREFNIAWTPMFSVKKFKEDESVTANLNGGLLVNFKLQADFNWSNQSFLRSHLYFRSGQFQPDPPERYPFQDNISTSDILASFVRKTDSSNWGFGIEIDQLSFVERVELERVQSTSRLLYGLNLEYDGSFWQLNYRGHLALIMGDQQFGGILRQSLSYPIWADFYLGIDGEYILISGSGLTTNQINGLLFLGWSF